MKKRIDLFLLISLVTVSLCGAVTAAQEGDTTARHERILGDLNADNNVDIEDALALFQHSMLPDLFPVDYPGSMDFDKNITVNISDAMKLFQYSMLPEYFPIEWGGEPYRPEGFDLYSDLESMNFHSPGTGIRVSYRLYLPEDYDPSVCYPLTVCLHSENQRGTDNQSQLKEAEMLFDSPYSPVYRSIVLIPQCTEMVHWAGSSKVQTALMDLVDYINETYHTDRSRQYYVGFDMGAKGIIQMMETHPDRISAAVFQGETGIYFLNHDGEITISGLPKALAKIPFCLAYYDYTYYTYFANLLRETITEMGGTNILLQKCHATDERWNYVFANEEDISVLEWLFRQNRSTDMSRVEPPKTEIPDVDVEYVDWFDPNLDFEYGEFTASNGITLPYRYFIPENYDDSKESPLLLFLHCNGGQGLDNERHMHQINSFFNNAKSPAFDSVVVMPQCPPGMWWRGGTIDAVAELLDYVNSEYSTDRSRQYVIGPSMGGDGTWDLICRYPQYISAAAPVSGVAYPCGNNQDGTMSLKGVDPKAFDVHVCHVYDTMDKYFDVYEQRLYTHILMTYGSEESTYRETSIYGHSIPYVTAEDISLLEWLYAQRRETTGRN